MSNPQTPPPGWFADPAGSPHNRWWDGTQWTDNLQQPYQSGAVPERAPEGTSPSTVQIWLIVGLFALQVVTGLVYIATFDFAGYMRASILATTNASDPSSALALYGYIFTPTYLALLAFGVIAYFGTALLAYFDAKELSSRGVTKPFPWALTFIPSYGSLIYLIGRSVVVRRRTGSGYGPLWVYIAVFVVGIIASIAVTVAMMGSMMSELSQYAS